MKRVVLCSKHHKARVIGPVLARIGYHVAEESQFDTDTLGTFTGEVERALTPEAAALYKARQACELTGAEYGLGSEGSFGGGPMPGLVNWNEEILCLYQASTDTWIYAVAAQGCAAQPLTVSNLDELDAELTQLPDQHWIIRTEDTLRKGLSADTVLAEAKDGALPMPLSLEPDFRAMHCPDRRQVIAKAADDLVRRLTALCPKCNAPNFVVKSVDTGLPCKACNRPTSAITHRNLRCDNCGYQAQEQVEQTHADPTHCNFCNP